jgi:hypothetical protein
MSMRRPAARIAAWAVLFRLFSAATAFVMNVAFLKPRGDQFPSPFGSSRAFWDLFTRYDSGWLFQIARYGYHYTPNGRDSIAYFPVYPLLMRYVGRVIGNGQADVYRGGIVVSWVAFVLAMVALYKLAELDLPRRRAERAVWLAAVFPFAFVYGVVYTEAVFLAATVACFYFFRTKRWILGGILGAVATATRVNGILMWPALAWLAWKGAQPRPDADATDRKLWSDRIAAVVALLMVGAGVGAYSLYVYSLSGNPFEWAETIKRWGYYPGGVPWLALFDLTRALVTQPIVYVATVPNAPYDALNGLTALLFVAAVPLVWRRFGAAYGLFMLANLWLPLSSGQFEGLGRYCAVQFPFFIWMASVRSRRVFAAGMVASAMLYGLCMALFTNFYPLF